MRFFVIIFFLGFLNSLFAQDVRFKHLGKKEGLSQSRVNAILQDKDGFIWFATDDGLNRYNGLEFTIYKNNVSQGNSISDNWITCLFEDSDGRIWVGTNEGGLNLYQKFTNNFKSYLSDEKETSISNDKVTCIIQKDKDHLWVGTGDGLNLFDCKTGKFTRIKDEEGRKSSLKIPNDNIRTLFSDHNGILWIGTEKNGLISYDEKNKKFKTHLKTDKEGLADPINSDRVRCIFEDGKQRLWVGFQGAGLAIYDRKTESFDFFENDDKNKSGFFSGSVQRIFEDHSGVIWIASTDGIFIYNEENDSFLNYKKSADDPFSLADDHIRCILEDRAHSIWLGTETAGISVFHRSSGKFNHVSQKTFGELAPLSNTIFAFAEGKENDIWVASIGGGISKINFSNKTSLHFDRDKNRTHNDILCFEKVGDELWFGSWGGGLGKVNLANEKFDEPKIVSDKRGLSNNTIIDLEKDEKGNLWLATFNGLNYYDVAKDTFYSYTKDNGYPFGVIYCLRLKDDILWVGTRTGGLMKFDTKTKKTVIYKKKSGDRRSLANNTVHGIFFDENEGAEKIWLATKNGLSWMDIKTGKCKNYYEQDGLSSNFILGVLQDKQQNLWISTNNGITRFNPEAVRDGRRFETRTYFEIDGLQSDEFNQNAFLLTEKGEMFFGGINGFNHFYPEKIIDNAYVPPVFITAFKIFGKEFETDTNILFKKYIELDYRENFISFEFASLDFLLPEKNLYSFKMEGLDENWSEPSTRNYISYSDLAGGDYIFMVRSSNNDGVWNDTGIRIHVRVIPPFYKTKWFYTVCIISTLILVFVFIRVRIAGINREKKILEEKVEERTSELAEKNRDIMSSIEYAKRIQMAILPERKVIFKHFPEAFIFYQPKDIVSGDFYWFGEVDSKKILAVVDCTGHGVPGAFMSMIGHNLLNQIVLENKITEPSKILQQLNFLVKAALKQENKEDDTRDGMDVALCVIDTGKNELYFAGAFRPVYIVRNASLEKIEGDKFPIGGAFAEDAVYTTHLRKLHSGDTIYIHSDGIVDQFGGPKGKKFMGKQLQSLLVENQELPMQEIKTLIIQKFTEWMADMEQVDDVLLIGIRYL